jgi:hypothetical protein
MNSTYEYTPGIKEIHSVVGSNAHTVNFA